MPNSLTVSDIQHFQSALMNSGIKLNTIKKYVRDIKKLESYLSEHSQLLSQSSLDSFLKSLSTDGYGVRSINSIIASIKSYCRYAGLTDLECKSLNIRKKNNKDNQMRLTEGEYEALLRTALNNENYRQVLLIQIFAITEIRINELQYLTVEALHNGFVIVPRVRETYEIFLPAELISDLYAYIEFYNIDKGIIFCTKKGTVLDRSYIWKQLKELALEAKVSPEKVYPQNLKRQLVREHFSIENLSGETTGLSKL